MKLNISPDLKLPLDTVTSTLVVYGAKGMGKSNFGSVLVEELSKAGLRWCYLDPLGVVWGLRHAADGKGPGVECLILGGAHGDIPIEPTGGAVVADLVVDESANVIIDFSRKPSGEMWSIGEKVKFITEYAKRLFQRQGGLVDGHRREPFFQILDEAARYIPQIIPHGNPQLAECVGAWDTLVEEGRNIGIGVGLLTQRSARMNKSVSEVADAMISFRIVGPNSIDAVMDWLGEHVPKSDIKKHVEALRSLERGRCLIVSPGWLKFEGVIGIRARETFDSSATPKPGERQKKVTGTAAKPDLAKYQERMKETIERVKENDPTALKNRVRELERQLRTAPAKVQSIAAKPIVDQNAIDRAVRGAESRIHASYREQTAGMERALKKAVSTLAGIATTAAVAANLKVPEMKPFVMPKAFAALKVEERPVARATPAPVEHHDPSPDENSNGELKGPELRILRAMGQLDAINKLPASIEMIAGWSSYSPNGGAFRNPLGALNTKEYIKYPRQGIADLTAKGREYVGTQDIPSQEEVFQRVRGTLKGPEDRILAVLIEANGEEVSLEDIAAKAGYAVNGGAFRNPLGALTTKAFIERPSKGVAKAAAWLFF